MSFELFGAHTSPLSASSIAASREETMSTATTWVGTMRMRAHMGTAMTTFHMVGAASLHSTPVLAIATKMEATPVNVIASASAIDMVGRHPAPLKYVIIYWSRSKQRNFFLGVREIPEFPNFHVKNKKTKTQKTQLNPTHRYDRTNARMRDPSGFDHAD
jgi:hypothetical protein